MKFWVKRLAEASIKTLQHDLTSTKYSTGHIIMDFFFGKKYENEIFLKTE